jgi:predicted flap endonuclease-1-like 5' DNA nuclease
MINFCWGLAVGFLLAWLWDFFFWRRKASVQSTTDAAVASRASGVAAAASVAASMPGFAGAVGATAGAHVARYEQDDIEQIEGIGPKIAELLRAQGLNTFSDLAATPVEKFSAILDAAGSRFKLANPGTWAEQAALAAKGDWAGFDKLTKELVAGVRMSADGVDGKDARPA